MASPARPHWHRKGRPQNHTDWRKFKK
uniref:Uncharacterized protein n=1 Tax=Anopheles dirus TaxID=7168 RepID=A0A182N884_9DIPT